MMTARDRMRACVSLGRLASVLAHAITSRDSQKPNNKLTVATSPMGNTSTLLPVPSPPWTARAATTTFLPAWWLVVFQRG